MLISHCPVQRDALEEHSSERTNKSPEIEHEEANPRFCLSIADHVLY